MSVFCSRPDRSLDQLGELRDRLSRGTSKLLSLVIESDRFCLVEISDEDARHKSMGANRF